MYPLLYKSNSSTPKPDDFTLIGRFTSVVSAIVSEERNGDYFLEMEITQNDPCVDKLTIQNFICAKPNFEDDVQFFEIYSIENDYQNNIKISAKHIKHILFNNFVALDSIIENSTLKLPPTSWFVKSCWGHAYNKKYDGDDAGSPYIGTGQMTLYPHYFSFRSDYSQSDSKPMPIANSAPFIVGDFLGGKEGSILDVFGGEYHFDNFKIKLLKSRGIETKFRLRYGSNISSLVQSVSTESSYSHCVAYAAVQNTDTTSGAGGAQKMYLYSKAYSFSNPGNLVRVFPLDVSDKEPDLKGNIRDESFKSSVTTKLNTYAKEYVKSNDRGIISNVTVDYATELEQMQNLKLCDTVWIDAPNTSWQAKIIKTEYDVIRERWKSLELGTPKLRLSDFFVRK